MKHLYNTTQHNTRVILFSCLVHLLIKNVRRSIQLSIIVFKGPAFIHPSPMNFSKDFISYAQGTYIHDLSINAGA